MEIIPAIDLLDGNCVRLFQGKYNEVTQFNTDPLNQALEWEFQGASRIHIVDLDAAKDGHAVNDSAIEKIVKGLNIPIQLGGGIRTLERAEYLLGKGIDRIILGTVAIEKPWLIEDLSNKYPGRVIVGIDAKQGKVATRGWLTESSVLASSLAKKCSMYPIAGIISTDISTDGTLEGPNVNALNEIALASNVPIIASGGVGSLSDLITLCAMESVGVTGIILGRALYDKKFSLKEALKVVSNYHLQDLIDKKEFVA